MKKIILAILAILAIVFIYKSSCSNTSESLINGREEVVADVEGNVLTLTSGLHARLLGVQAERTDVEMFLRSKYIGKPVVIYADSHSRKQYIDFPSDTVDVYVVEKGAQDYCVNHLVVREYPDTYRETEIYDSSGWVLPNAAPVEKRNLALYMKQRTFLIQTSEGIGTGFFINENGLAVTNWHVLKPGAERNSIAVLFQDDKDDSQVYSDKKRNFKNILWSSDVNGLDITIVSVELENNETVPFFNIARQRPNQGDKVSTYGNPKGLTASYSSGVLSAFRPDPFNPSRDVQLIQYDMSTNGGNSGGPVCDIYGQIIAIHEIGDKDAQGINYGIDAMQLRAVLDKLGLKYGGK